MKTTIDIPDQVLEEALAHTGARTKREAIVTAVEDYNQRKRTAALARHLGTCSNLMTPEDLERLRSSE